ncbi:hypothetical protein DFR70_10244 [Nocardia tenerifensis]|uniref:Uncharacterized protein n=1 Tax=Nocardia tenerifensis TaxID=228006 RepID=A0A318K6P6_9NOCA|nr:hypothetical protein [Nocardia tenerifensis]PXX68364.1 hypothetical protein DFR70_10244 [Nocardia tenerifensis]
MRSVIRSTFVATTIALGLLGATGHAASEPNPIIGFYPTLVECMKAGAALDDGPLAHNWHCHAETDDWTGPNTLYAGK